MLKITKTLDGKFEQVAIEVDDFDITEPFVSECGRFQVDRHRKYGIEPKFAELLNSLNCYLRGESAVSETDAEQQLYVAQGYGSCPECGQGQAEGGDITVENNTAFQECSCSFCGAVWSDNYHLIGFTLTEQGRFDDEDTAAQEALCANHVLADSSPEKLDEIEGMLDEVCDAQ